MQTILIGRKRRALLIDDADYPLVSQLRLQTTTQGYVTYATQQFAPSGQRCRRLLHNLIVGPHPGQVVDHINGNPLDNRRQNLRVVSHTLNVVNRHKQHRRNTTGIRGVYDRSDIHPKKPYYAMLCVNYKLIDLGYFATKEEAQAARRAAELKYYGEQCPIPTEAAPCPT